MLKKTKREIDKIYAILAQNYTDLFCLRKNELLTTIESNIVFDAMDGIGKSLTALTKLEFINEKKQENKST